MKLRFKLSDGGSGDNFGYSIAVGSNRLVVGARFEDAQGNNAGAAYVYNLDGTNEVKISETDLDASDYFGAAVAVGDNKVVIGCGSYDGDTNQVSQQGAVFVYNLDGTNKIKIQPSDGGTDDQFGSAVAVGEGKIFVSSPYWDVGGLQNTGQVYAYNLDGTNEEKLIMPSAVAYDNIGYQKVISGWF